MMFYTIREAATEWVYGFNAVPTAVVKQLMRLDLDDVREITPGRRDEDAVSLPMWGTMWSFGDSADDYWLEEEDGLELMAECGFRIYEQEDFGYLFGIDGAGYSFMEAHWIPLYKARGLHWHREEEPAPTGGGLVQKILEGRA